MKKKSLTSYLLSVGITKDSSPEEIQAAKAAYRATYMKQKIEVFRQKNRSVTLSFPNNEARAMEAESKNCGMKLPAYLKSCIRAYRNQTFVLPDDEAVRQLELELQSIGSFINGLERTMRISGDIELTTLHNIRHQLEVVEQMLSKLLREPVEFQEYVRQQMTADPTTLIVLLHLIADHIKTPSYVYQNSPASRAINS